MWFCFGRQYTKQLTGANVHVLKPNWVIVISCGALKGTRAAPAFDMYKSAYFRMNFRWAESVFDRRKIFILSAKYGLIACETIIEPYDLRMGMSGSVRVETVLEQARALGVGECKACFLGGREYETMLRNVFPDVRRPGGSLTMGYQMRLLKKNMGKFPWND